MINQKILYNKLMAFQISSESGQSAHKEINAIIIYCKAFIVKRSVYWLKCRFKTSAPDVLEDAIQNGFMAIYDALRKYDGRHKTFLGLLDAWIRNNVYRGVDIQFSKYELRTGDILTNKTRNFIVINQNEDELDFWKACYAGVYISTKMLSTNNETDQSHSLWGEVALDLLIPDTIELEIARALNCSRQNINQFKKAFFNKIKKELKLNSIFKQYDYTIDDHILTAQGFRFLFKFYKPKNIESFLNNYNKFITKKQLTFDNFNRIRYAIENYN